MKLIEAHKTGVINAKDLSEHCGVSVQAVYKWLNGTTPRIQHIKKISEFTDGKVCINDFI